MGGTAASMELYGSYMTFLGALEMEHIYYLDTNPPGCSDQGPEGAISLLLMATAAFPKEHPARRTVRHAGSDKLIILCDAFAAG